MGCSFDDLSNFPPILSNSYHKRAIPNSIMVVRGAGLERSLTGYLGHGSFEPSPRATIVESGIVRLR
jgi:hypothetical protein